MNCGFAILLGEESILNLEPATLNGDETMLIGEQSILNDEESMLIPRFARLQELGARLIVSQSGAFETE